MPPSTASRAPPAIRLSPRRSSAAATRAIVSPRSLVRTGCGCSAAPSRAQANRPRRRLEGDMVRLLVIGIALVAAVGAAAAPPPGPALVAFVSDQGLLEVGTDSAGLKLMRDGTCP